MLQDYACSIYIDIPSAYSFVLTHMTEFGRIFLFACMSTEYQLSIQESITTTTYSWGGWQFVRCYHTQYSTKRFQWNKSLFIQLH